MKRHSEQSTDSPRVTFWGAAQSVTGSMHLVEAAGRRILLDCGLVRGRRDEARRRDARFPFPPSEIDAVVLSHAHIDHCGNLPNLVRQGFCGPIYCTPATRDLTAVMLGDSARIQEEDAVVAGVVHGAAADPPLYIRSDAHRVVAQCTAVPYETPHEITPDVRLRFLDAGHILGSAMAELTIARQTRLSRITFTGDLGRRGLPFLREPSIVPSADLLICESTYGGRVHEGLDRLAPRMGDVVRRTLARGGKVLIPAFSLGRTQIVVHYLRRWMRDGVLPQAPLYVDSPTAADIAEVYDRYEDHFAADAGGGLPPVTYVRTAEDSKDLCLNPEPYIVVASGGMCDGGRIMTYLRQYIDDLRAAIVLVSYQAAGTLGRQLLDKKPTVRFHGRTWNKWAEVVEANGFSGHADQSDFLALLGGSAGQTAQVRLVHGEPEQAAALARSLREHGFADVEAPRLEETAEVA
ncbi:MAG TPA: MBL fold metallo-hydrolase [Gemmataceae bacterium]|nr:MBL fold metallo-hydrolase [Gemmataceae bacterium]